MAQPSPPLAQTSSSSSQQSQPQPQPQQLLPQQPQDQPVHGEIMDFVDGDDNPRDEMISDAERELLEMKDRMLNRANEDPNPLAVLAERLAYPPAAGDAPPPSSSSDSKVPSSPPTTLSPAAQASLTSLWTSPPLSVKPRKLLRGHFGKIFAVAWCGNSRHLLSAGQDGKLLLWQAMTTDKIQAIELRSPWVMSCAITPNGTLIAAGGMDNVATLYRIDEPFVPSLTQHKPVTSLVQHEGYVSGCKFLENNGLVTSSGDGTIIVWDIESRDIRTTFQGHDGDVMSVDVDSKSGLLVSGSVDACAKIWDWRDRRGCVFTFRAHDSDINAVRFFPDGNCIGTASDDSTARLMDLRSMTQLNRFVSDRVLCPLTSVDFSASGRFLLAGYDDCTARIWNTVTTRLESDEMIHDNRVSTITVSPDGKAICTASWDTQIKIWA